MGEKFLGEKCMGEKVYGRRKVYGGKVWGQKMIGEESLGEKSGGERYMVEQLNSLWVKSIWVRSIWVKGCGWKACGRKVYGWKSVGEKSIYGWTVFQRVHSHPHPPATFPSNAFSSDSLLFQSLPKHRILTDVASNPCDHSGPTSEPKYWQNLLLIRATIMAPTSGPSKYKSTSTSSSTSSGDLSKQCLFLWLPSIPVSPKASYTDRSCF